MRSRFWSNWVPEYKNLLYGAFALLLFSLGLLWYYYVTGPAGVVQWEKLHDQKTVETISHTFDVGSFEFSIPIESFVSYEYFNGSSYRVDYFAAYSFVIVLFVVANLLLALVTTFRRFWFLVGCGLFILFVISLRPEVFRIAGIYGQWPTVVILLLYLVPAFYFHAFRMSTSFVARLATFLMITLGLGIVIHFLALVEYPFLHLWVTGYTPAIIMTGLFILLIGHEILAAFIYLVSQGTSSSKSLRHFMIITAVYIANLIILYMHEANLIQWDFLYINVYLLLSVSGILAIWGYKNREPLYENVMTFAPFGALFIIALATIAFITTGTLLGGANDPAIKIIRDLIVFSHLGLGVIFFTYIISNFILMLAENYNVYKVLYKPTRMPFVTFRIAGLIAVLGFIFYSDWRQYVYNGLSGFYNNLGDLYVELDRNTLAEAYFEQGKTYGFRNNHSNYVLGDMNARAGDFDKAAHYYESANGKRPTPYSLANYANLYVMRGQVFQAIDAYRHALLKMPDDGALQNNIGYCFAKVHNLDSAVLMLERARASNETRATAEINFAAFICQEYLPVKADSLQSLFESSALLRANLLAVATVHGQNFLIDTDVLASRELDLNTATQLNNYMVKNLKSLDTTFLSKAESIIDDSLNLPYRESLKLTLAHAWYHQNHVSKALEIMGELAYISQSKQGEYNYISGLWALEQGSAELAASYFSYAELEDYKKARVYNAIAFAEAGVERNALGAAELLLTSADTSNYAIARELKKIMTTPLSQLTTDEARYQYFRYRTGIADTITFNALIRSMTDPNIKAKALLEMSERQFRRGNTAAAIRYINGVSGLKLSDKTVYQRVQHHELRMLASRGELRMLANQINQGVTFDKKYELEKLLYKSLLDEASGDTLTAAKQYDVLGKYNPFFEEGVLAAARYFQTHGTDPLKAYTLLTNAVQVNRYSVRLYEAYLAEALRLGFDNFAEDAREQLIALRSRPR